MATRTKKDPESKIIDVVRIEQATVNLAILGTTPLIMHRFGSARDLLLPPRKKNTAEKESTLKHDIVKEFRDSCYLSNRDDDPTRLYLLATAFKSALASVAIDLPGDAKKAQVARLTWVNGQWVHIYGVPELFTTMVRMADAKKTPDMRTRAILPEWACMVSVTFTKPLLNEETIFKLLAAAGVMQGVGDWRNEKGKGTYGQFTIVPPDDENWNRIVDAGGRVAQDKALSKPGPYDVESAELMDWFFKEAKSRGFKVTR